MRRPLVFIAVFYMCGITAAELFSYFPFSTMLITILILVSAISFGFSYMLLRGRIPADDISNFANGEKMTITGTVAEPAARYSQRVVATLKSSTILKGNDEVPISG